jgi:hypothetical protein
VRATCLGGPGLDSWFRDTDVGFDLIMKYVKVKVKQSLYTQWRRLGGEEV